jgi:hypothetical protein
MRQARLTIAVCVLATALFTEASAQTLNRGLIDWDLHVLETAPLAGSFLAYGERPVLQINLVVYNRSDSRVSLDLAQVINGFRLRIFLGSTELPIVFQWEPGIVVTGKSQDRLSVPSGPLTLEPRSSVGRELSVRRNDGQPFVAGDYGLVGTTNNFGAALQTLGGERWIGRSEDGGSPRILLIRPPETQREVSLMHYLAAKEAGRKNDSEKAVQEYENAVLADRTHDLPVFALAGTFASLRQFDRAIQTYEEILGRFATNPALVERASEGLARAHLGAGNPAGAIQTFRRLGMSEENARAKVEKLR